MPDSNVIADVSALLKYVLDAQLADLGSVGAAAPVANYDDLNGKIATDPPNLTLTLFEIIEDPSACNRPRVQKRAATASTITETKPSMALLLKYLVTAWGGDRLLEQQMLGRVLQLFYDTPIITAPIVTPALRKWTNLSDTQEQLKVTLAPLTLEERTRVWYAVQKPYKLSLCYEVRVVNMDAVKPRTLNPIKVRSLSFFTPERA